MRRDVDTHSDEMASRHVAGLLTLVEERGYSVESVLEFAGIDFDPTRKDDPRYLPSVSAEQYSRLYQQVLELLQDAGFGVTNQRIVTPGAFRMMCYAIIHCDSLGSALRRASYFFRIFFEGQALLSVRCEEGRALVGYCKPCGSGEEPTPQTEIYAMAMWHRFCAWLTGRTLALQEVHFQGAEPTRGHFDALFGCPVSYGQQQTAIIFDAQYLQRSLVHTEHSLKTFLKTAPFQLMVMPTRATDSSLVSQVRAMIGHDFSQGFPVFEQIARQLNMSVPTLRRHLKREGATFQELKDESRRDAAVAYLNRPDLSINAVAALMGFTDPSAFHRSFKRWTGMPPGEYRRSMLDEGFDVIPHQSEAIGV